MRTCTIHIGTHKTGSTAIQNAFSGYNDGKTKMLRLPQPNHSSYIVALFAAPSMKKGSLRRLKVPERDRESYLVRLRKSIVEQFQSDTSDYVVSGETLSSHLKTEQIADLKQFLSTWFDTFKIIIYFREPVSFARSAFQQTAKGTDFEPFILGIRSEYRERTHGWIEVFGRTNVDVVLYDPNAFAQGSVVHDFAHRCGTAVPSVHREKSNIRSFAEGFAITYVTRNRLVSEKMPLLQRAKLRGDLFMAREFGRHEFELSNTIAKKILDQQKDDIAWAEELMTKRFPEFAPKPGALSFGSYEDIAKFAAACRPEFETWKRKRFGPVRRAWHLVRGLRRLLQSPPNPDDNGREDAR